MNDLIIPSKFAESFPTITEGLKKAVNIFNSIKSFEDIENVFLKGAGLSQETYRSYLQAIKQFYEYTNGLNPLQVKPRHIEAFYDDLVKKVDRNTACLRIQGLKRFFKGIRNVIPFYTSPFEIMDEKLKKKLSRKKKDRTKKALNIRETKEIFKLLKSDKTLKGKFDYAIAYFLVNSGLRAFELLQLRWKDIEESEESEGFIYAYFTGKGNKPDKQEIPPEALKAVKDYFKSYFKRDPKPDEYLFYTLPRYPGEPPRRLEYQTLYNHIRWIGEKVKEAGILKRDIQFTPHLFRRTYASLLYKKGMKLKAIQEKTRHASIETLVNHYIDDSEPATPYLKAVFAI